MIIHRDTGHVVVTGIAEGITKLLYWYNRGHIKKSQNNYNGTNDWQ